LLLQFLAQREQFLGFALVVPEAWFTCLSIQFGYLFKLPINVKDAPLRIPSGL
jgi:hypothetical protein